MSVTVKQITQRLEKRGLVFLGKTTSDSSAGELHYLVDTARLGHIRRDPDFFGDAWVLFDAADAENTGLVSQVLRTNALESRLYFSPDVTDEVEIDTEYEVWMHGIHPDDFYRALNRALTEKCSQFLPAVVSEIERVEDWGTAAYSEGTGGDSNASASLPSIDPATDPEFATACLRVANSGANGYASSEGLKVQPNQRFVIHGYVSVAAQTASVRLRDTTNDADITLEGPATTFTLSGWQYFEIHAVVPDGCSAVELWLGGASASCDARWAQVGLRRTRDREFFLQTATTGPRAVGKVWERLPGDAKEQETNEVARDTSTSGTRTRLLVEPTERGLYYDERTYFDAIIASDLYTAAQRATARIATTTCDIRYAEAAALVELLGADSKKYPHLADVLEDALVDLAQMERDQGPEPVVAPARPRRPVASIMQL